MRLVCIMKDCIYNTKEENRNNCVADNEHYNQCIFRKYEQELDEYIHRLTDIEYKHRNKELVFLPIPLGEKVVYIGDDKKQLNKTPCYPNRIILFDDENGYEIHLGFNKGKDEYKEDIVDNFASMESFDPTWFFNFRSKNNAEKQT